MWIVNLALRRPYTFVVAALLILLIGSLAALRMPVDIFPSIDIPIIGVAWQYQGLPPDQMSGRIITPCSISRASSSLEMPRPASTSCMPCRTLLST